ncbi:Uncharacterised protein [Vibrio cholerae]|nr:Uncharacterised protein [Vibrio cholerae]
MPVCRSRTTPPIVQANSRMMIAGIIAITPLGAVDSHVCAESFKRSDRTIETAKLHSAA